MWVERAGTTRIDESSQRPSMSGKRRKLRQAAHGKCRAASLIVIRIVLISDSGAEVLLGRHPCSDSTAVKQYGFAMKVGCSETDMQVHWALNPGVAPGLSMFVGVGGLCSLSKHTAELNHGTHDSC